jgi:hypothetical protein
MSNSTHSVPEGTSDRLSRLAAAQAAINQAHDLLTPDLTTDAGDAGIERGGLALQRDVARRLKRAVILLQVLAIKATHHNHQNVG